MMGIRNIKTLKRYEAFYRSPAYTFHPLRLHVHTIWGHYLRIPVASLYNMNLRIILDATPSLDLQTLFFDLLRDRNKDMPLDDESCAYFLSFEMAFQLIQAYVDRIAAGIPRNKLTRAQITLDSYGAKLLTQASEIQKKDLEKYQVCRQQNRRNIQSLWAGIQTGTMIRATEMSSCCSRAQFLKYLK